MLFDSQAQEPQALQSGEAFTNFGEKCIDFAVFLFLLFYSCIADFLEKVVDFEVSQTQSESQTYDFLSVKRSSITINLVLY